MLENKAFCFLIFYNYGSNDVIIDNLFKLCFKYIKKLNG